jgi:hypothetical protein
LTPRFIAAGESRRAGWPPTHAVIPEAHGRRRVVIRRLGILALVLLVLVGPAVAGSDTAARKKATTCFGKKATIEVIGSEPAFDTPEDDVIVGDDQTKFIMTGASVDRVCGGGSPDRIEGSFDAPDGARLFANGGDGADLILGTNNGNDHLIGGKGDDTIAGRGGDDRLSGGDGDDRMAGNEANDALAGDDGDDEIFGDGSGRATAAARTTCPAAPAATGSSAATPSTSSAAARVTTPATRISKAPVIPPSPADLGPPPYPPSPAVGEPTHPDDRSVDARGGSPCACSSPRWPRRATSTRWCPSPRP